MTYRPEPAARLPHRGDGPGNHHTPADYIPPAAGHSPAHLHRGDGVPPDTPAFCRLPSRSNPCLPHPNSGSPGCTIWTMTTSSGATERPGRRLHPESTERAGRFTGRLATAHASGSACPALPRLCPVRVSLGQQLCSRQLRTFTPSAAMYKYTAGLAVRLGRKPGLLSGQRREDSLITARSPAVISSPNWGVFAVTAAGPGLRRGHVIYSGVFAVAAVTAAAVPCLVHSLACPAGSAEGIPSSLISSPSAPGCCRQRMAPRSSRAS